MNPEQPKLSHTAHAFFLSLPAPTEHNKTSRQDFKKIRKKITTEKTKKIWKIGTSRFT